MSFKSHSWFKGLVEAGYPVWRGSVLAVLWLSLGCDSLQGEILSSRAFASKSSDSAQSQGFLRVMPEACGIGFRNDLDPLKGAANRVLFNGSGLALGDLNGDQRPDVFFCAIDGSNELYINQGDWQFTKHSLKPSLADPGIPSRGVVFADINGDARLDILLATVGRGVLTFLNRGDLEFEDISTTAGLETSYSASGLALADVDGNGTLDLYVANNRVDDIRDKARVPIRRVGNQILPPEQWEDRLFVHRSQLHEYGEADQLYLNDGQGVFTPVSWTGGAFRYEGKTLEAPPRDWGLSAMFGDWNGDGASDLYVCNDFWTPDRLWLGDGKGGFDALNPAALAVTSASSMGVDMADVDQDGDWDLMVVDMLDRDPRRRKGQLPAVNLVADLPELNGPWMQVNRNTLLLQQVGHHFVEGAHMAGVEASGWSWCPIFMDVDLDGLDDLLVSAGYPHDMQDMDTLEKIQSLQHPWQGYSDEAALQAAFTQEMLEHIDLYPSLHQPVAAFRNLGGGAFQDVTDLWGTSHPAVHQGFATADLDGDGDLDLVLNCLNAAPILYRNQAAADRLAITLVGSGSNTSAVGASLILEAEGRAPIRRTVMAGGRYLSHGDATQILALSAEQASSALHVQWPDGHQTTYRDLVTNHHYQLAEGSRDHQVKQVPNPDPASARLPMFRDASHLLGHALKRTGSSDLLAQPGLPLSQSQGASSLSCVDVNGDGLSDIILGGVRGEQITLFESVGQGASLSFQRRQLAYRLTNDSTGMLVMGLPDGGFHLLVGQDGYQASGQASLVEFNLKGQWRTLFSKALPGIHSLAAGPWLGSGNLGVLGTGHTIARAYPQCYPSAMIHTDAGSNTGWRMDPGLTVLLKTVERPRAVLWCDLRGDGYPELVLASHGGSLRLFENQQGKFNEATAEWGLDRWAGLWTSLAAADLDGNGSMDLVAGNLGTNTPWEASLERPLSWYVGDPFAQGRQVVLETVYHQDGKLAPSLPRDAMANLLPSLRGQGLSHRAYQDMAMQDLLKDHPEGWSRLQASTLESMVFFNDGQGRLDAKPLPRCVQQAPVLGLQASDVNGDGWLDLLVGQGSMKRGDGASASYPGGLILLLGSGDGGFKEVDTHLTGLPFNQSVGSLALGDFNGDHRMDFVATMPGGTTRLFLNQQTSAAGMPLRARGRGNNPMGIGLRLQGLDSDGQVMLTRDMPGGGAGWHSQNDALIIIPTETANKRWRVRWPGGDWQPLAMDQGSTAELFLKE